MVRVDDYSPSKAIEDPIPCNQSIVGALVSAGEDSEQTVVENGPGEDCVIRDLHVRRILDPYAITLMSRDGVSRNNSAGRIVDPNVLEYVGADIVPYDVHAHRKIDCDALA